MKLALFALLSTTLVSADAVYAAQAQQARAERSKLGLVLSGGGARGFAHIGALKALEELRVRFDVIAGTSMGSMVGGAYAAGYSAKQIEDITLAVDWPRMFAPRPDRDRMDWQGKDNDRRGLGPTEIGVTRDGLRFSGQLVPSQELDIFLQRSTEPFNSVYDLSELDIPFAAVATDLESGQRVVLQKEISLAQAMRCSMSVPGAFRPAEPTHIIYVARDKEKLIADIIDSDYDTEEKTLRILSIDAEKRNRKICDYVIHNDTIEGERVSGAEEIRRLILLEGEKY